jgi:hypothetical protein
LRGMEGFYVILGLGLRREVPNLRLRSGQAFAKEARSGAPSVVKVGDGVMGVGIFQLRACFAFGMPNLRPG